VFGRLTAGFNFNAHVACIFRKINTVEYFNSYQTIFVAAVVKNNGFSINYLRIVVISYFFGEVTDYNHSYQPYCVEARLLLFTCGRKFIVLNVSVLVVW